MHMHLVQFSRLPTPEERGRAAYAKARASGSDAMDAACRQISGAFDSYATLHRRKLTARARIRNGYSDLDSRLRCGWLFREFEDAQLALDQALTFLDYAKRSIIKHGTKFASVAPEGRTVSLPTVEEMRLVLRYLRRFRRELFPQFVREAAVPVTARVGMHMQAAE